MLLLAGCPEGWPDRACHWATKQSLGGSNKGCNHSSTRQGRGKKGVWLYLRKRVAQSSTGYVVTGLYHISHISHISCGFYLLYFYISHILYFYFYIYFYYYLLLSIIIISIIILLFLFISIFFLYLFLFLYFLYFLFLYFTYSHISHISCGFYLLKNGFVLVSTV